MIDLSQKGYTHEQVLSMMQCANGAEQVSYRCDVMSGGVRKCAAQMQTGGRISCNAMAEIKLTASITVFDDKNIDWINDRFKVFQRFKMPDGEVLEYPLGLYVPSTISGTKYRTVEGYDLCIYMQEDCITERLFFPVGTKYTDAISSIIVSAGISNAIIDPCESLMLSDREDWEIGTSKLAIVNQLLAEINFRSLEVNLNGVIRARKYEEITGENVGIIYRAGTASIVAPKIERTADSYNVPNVFHGCVSNPDYDAAKGNQEEFVYTYINDSPASALSTARRGRRIVKADIRPDNIASQEALQAYVRRAAINAMTAYEHTKFSTAPVPYHGVAEVLGLDIREARGVYGETAWELPLDGTQMQHSCRKLVILL